MKEKGPPCAPPIRRAPFPRIRHQAGRASLTRVRHVPPFPQRTSKTVQRQRRIAWQLGGEAAQGEAGAQAARQPRIMRSQTAKQRARRGGKADCSQ